MQTTFAIIKPDAVKAGHTGAILSRIQQAGFRVAGMRLQHLSKREAEGLADLAELLTLLRLRAHRLAG